MQATCDYRCNRLRNALQLSAASFSGDTGFGFLLAFMTANASPTSATTPDHKKLTKVVAG
jgi:hypothetical protein